MAEKVTIGNCELWHGDALDVLPLLPTIGAMVSDPPRFMSGTATERSEQAGFSRSRWWPSA
jgi:hypothetical protein